MATTARHGIFISYAWRDGKEFAVKLRQRIMGEAPDVQVWQDLVEMEGGVGWWRQIEEALEHVEILVIVMTPGVLASKTTRQEWRYARQQGISIYPVKGPNYDAGDRAIPRWMKKAHCYDLDQQWATFLAHIKRGGERARVPLMAPDLPANFVPRPKEYGQIKSLLLEGDKLDPIAITTALRGAGGFGKSVLACAICHDDDVNLAFDDGILWVTLGEQPNIPDALIKLYAGLTGERPAFADIEDASNSLAEKLRFRNCLIVVDDVWDPGHIKPFLRGGPGCARLITTRIADVIGDAKAKCVKVDQMSSRQSAQLLVSRLESKPSDLIPFERLARKLGEWPILLKLVGAVLSQRVEWGDTHLGALEYVTTVLGRHGITAFDRRSDVDRNAAVAATMDASTRLLTPDERQRYFELGIFPEDVAIPLNAIADVWSCDEIEAQRVVTRLTALSLVEYELPTEKIFIHDVLREYLAGALGEPGLRAAHGRLVDGWGNPCRLKSEYAWNWIAYHLANSSQGQRLRDLLLNLGWLEAKLDASDIIAVISDFKFAEPNHLLQVLRNTLQLSSHVLVRTKSNLAQQLLARIPEAESELRESILAQALTSIAPWLRPLCPRLIAPGGALLRTLQGHEDRILSVAIDAHGTRAISSSIDWFVYVWDLREGRILRSLEGHLSLVNAVAISADGKIAITGGSDGLIKVWDVDSGQEQHSFEGHRGSVTSLALASDDRKVLSGDDNHHALMWDLHLGECIHVIEHQDSVEGTGLDADGKIAMTFDPRNIALWDAEGSWQMRSLEIGSEHVGIATLSASGRLVLATHGATIHAFDVVTGQRKCALAGHTDPVESIAITADDRRAVSASSDRTLILWDLQSATALRTFEGHADTVSSVALTADSRYAISGSYDRMLKLWDLERDEQSQEKHLGRVTAIAPTLDGSRVISASEDGSLKLWNIENGRLIHTLEAHTDSVTAVALSSDNRHAVSASHDKTLRLWDLDGYRLLGTLGGHSDFVTDVVITPDQCAISASDDSSIKRWALTSKQRLKGSHGHGQRIHTLKLSADGSKVLSAGDDAELRLWDTTTGTELGFLAGHADGITACALTANGKMAVSGSKDGTLRVWNLARERVVRTFRNHGAEITALVLARNDELVVSAGEYGDVLAWELGTGNIINSFSRQTGRINALAKSKDERYLAAGGDDGTLRIWSFSNAQLLASFASDSSISNCAFTHDGCSVVAGDARGAVHILRLENFGFHG